MNTIQYEYLYVLDGNKTLKHSLALALTLQLVTLMLHPTTQPQLTLWTLHRECLLSKGRTQAHDNTNASRVKIMSLPNIPSSALCAMKVHIVMKRLAHTGFYCYQVNPLNH